MDKNKFVKQLINLRVMLESFYESTNNINLINFHLTMRVKVLFYVGNNSMCSPSFLIEKLQIAKSNLAIICKGLMEEGLIDSKKDENDKRNIYYTLTERGQQELESYYNHLTDLSKAGFSAKEIKTLEKRFDEIMLIFNKASKKTVK